MLKDAIIYVFTVIKRLITQKGKSKKRANNCYSEKPDLHYSVAMGVVK